LRTRLINKSKGRLSHIYSFASEVSERNRNSFITNVLSVTNKNGFVLQKNNFERRIASDDLSNYKVVRCGMFAYNPSRINVGSIARLDCWNEGVLSPMYVAFSIDENLVDSDYFLNWLRSDKAQQKISNSAQGSVRETVSFNDLSSIKIPLPPLPEQIAIAEILSTADEEISILKRKLDALKLQKRGLMQKLLTGEWSTACINILGEIE
jgi:type I restriction enzyme S subunit